jgi:peptidoglycan L-alanyl-D-glutamate endopeptidase CwlK
MPAFTSERSKRVLSELDPRLQAVVIEAIKHIDFSLIDGIRTVEQQQALYNATPPSTTLDGIIKRSKHQGKSNLPSARAGAFDFIPAPFTVWEDQPLFTAYAHFFLGIGIAKGIELRWGGDFNRNFRPDESFIDYPHIELVNW